MYIICVNIPYTDPMGNMSWLLESHGRWSLRSVAKTYVLHVCTEFLSGAGPPVCGQHAQAPVVEAVEAEHHRPALREVLSDLVRGSWPGLEGRNLPWNPLNHRARWQTPQVHQLLRTDRMHRKCLNPGESSLYWQCARSSSMHRRWAIVAFCTIFSSLFFGNDNQ